MTASRSRCRAPLLLAATWVLTCCSAAASGWDPAADRLAFREYYAQRFPQLASADFVDGVYAIDPRLTEQWMEIQDFPPYEFMLDEGRALFEQPFADRAGYARCFDVTPAAIARGFPRFEAAAGAIVTLPLALNRCREAHGEVPLVHASDPMVALLAYLAHAARGGVLDDLAPVSTAGLGAYEEGRALFYSKRGQLNFSCADCHVNAVGARLRQQRLTPLLGVVNRYPAYWLRWGSMGTLHQRFAGCMERVRAESYPIQGRELRALEYFLAVMSAGLPMRGPSTQR